MGWISWLCPGMNLKRWLLLFTVGVLCCALGLALFFNYQFMGYVEELMFRMAYLTHAGRLFVPVHRRLCHDICNKARYPFRCGSSSAGQ